jgi:hypothetical protein
MIMKRERESKIKEKSGTKERKWEVIKEREDKGTKRERKKKM